MATHEDIELMLENAETDDRIPMLRRYVQECEQIARGLTTALEGDLDPRSRRRMEELRDYSLEAIDILNERIAIVEADRADPNYERRKAERLASKHETNEALERAVESAAQSIGGFFRRMKDKARSFDEKLRVPLTKPQPGAAPGIRCPKCGAASPDDARFCLKCGARLDSAGKCASCGKALSAQAKFCPECGEKQP